MSDALRRALDALHHDAGDEGYDPFDPAGPTARLALVREAVARLAHGTMTYECEACGYRARVWLTIGVEGPPALKLDGAYLPCPFMVRCWACAGQRGGGTMKHVDWGADDHFEPELVPDDVAYFVLPHRVDRSDAGAELVVSGEALVAGRRYFAERGS